MQGVWLCQQKILIIRASAPLSDNSQQKAFYSPAPKRQGIFCVRTQRLGRTQRLARSARSTRSLRKGHSQCRARVNGCKIFIRNFLAWLLLAVVLLSCDPEEGSSKKNGGPTVTGTETLADGSTITSWSDGTKHLVIDPSVTSIASWAFYQKQLTSVIIPPSVSSPGSIGAGSFADNQLKEVILPEEIYVNQGSAFDDNPGVKFYLYDASRPGKKGRRLKG